MSLEIERGYPRDLPRGLLLLPDNDAVREAALGLLSDDGAILAPQTFTPKSFISEIEANLDMPEPLDNVAHVLLVKGLMSNTPEFAGVARMSGLVSDLASLILDLRKAGIFSGKELLSRLSSNLFRHNRLSRILDGYAAELLRRGASDGPERENAAVERLLRNGPTIAIPRGGVHALWFGNLRASEARIIVALARHANVRFYLPARDGSPIGEKLAAAANASKGLIEEIAHEFDVDIRDVQSEGSPAPDALLSAIANRSGSIDEIPPSSFDGWPRLTVLSAKNPVEEASLVASAAKALCLDRDVRPEEIAIFCDEPRLIVRALREHGLPFRGGDTRSFAESDFGELIGRIVEVVESDFGRMELFRLLKHKLMRIDSIPQMDSIACSAGIVGGTPIEEAWIARLERLDDPASDKLIDLLRKLAGLIEGAGGTRAMSGRAFAETFDRFFEGFDILGAVEAMAADSGVPIRDVEFVLDAYEKTIDFLKRFADSPPDSFAGHCALLLSFLSSGGPSDNGGEGVRLLPLSALGRTNCRIAILPNAVQGRLPKSERSFLFLNRSEAAALGLTLPNGLLRKLFDIFSMVERARLTIVTHALAEGDSPLPPSPALLSLERALGENKADYRRSMETLASKLLSRPFTKRRRQVAAGELFTHPFSEFDGIAERFVGIEALENAARATELFRIQKNLPPDRFDGMVGPAFGEYLRKTVEKIGATRIDRYNRCPFAFFMENILEIEGPPKPEEEFDQKTKGIVLHRTMELFWRGRIERFFGKTPPKQRLEMLIASPQKAHDAVAITPEDIDKSIEEIAAAMDTALSSIEDWPSDFVRWDFERELRDATAAYIEVVASIEDRFIPISTEFKLERRFGNSIVVGKADRIDADAEGRLRIVDYKYNHAPNNSQIAAKMAIQLPIYCAMLDDLGEGIAGLYWEGFATAEPKPSGRFEPTASSSEFEKYIEELLGKMAAGQFPPKPAGGKCPDYCAFAKICGYDAARPLPEGWDD